MSDLAVRNALELFEPVFPAAEGDWDAVLERAGLTSSPRLVTGRRALVVAVAATLAVVLVATPAFGLRGLISDLFGRHDVPFTGKIAPTEIKRDFYDMGLGAPAGMAPRAIAQRARRVAAIRVGPKTHVLWVAPTRSGGFCWLLTGAFGGCRPRRLPPFRVHGHGYVNPGVLGVVFGEISSRHQRYDSNVGGTIRTPKGSALTIEFADGTKQPIPFYYVSKPIDAGFFFAAIRPGHQTVGTRPLAVILRDRHGRVLARQPFLYASRVVRVPRAGGKPVRPPVRPARLSPPTPPFQRGSGGGVTAVAGWNGVVVFDTTHASRAARRLISGTVDYGCFARVPYHPVPEAIETIATTAPRVAIRVDGLSPFLGCDVEGFYGHRWPDRLHEHSAVEIPFGQAGRQFFADRAAARDLGLFIRSADMHRIRKLHGAPLERALRARYGTTVLRLASSTSSLPADRVGYAPSGRGTVYVERSTTGRRFFVRVVDGRIASQDVRPLGFVF